MCTVGHSRHFVRCQMLNHETQMSAEVKTMEVNSEEHIVVMCKKPMEVAILVLFLPLLCEFRQEALLLLLFEDKWRLN